MFRLLPTREHIRRHRWPQWIGPRLHHPRLWRWSRHGVALGVALGVFFGLLIPVAQIPVSAGAAVALRANLPAAVASTLVTNPLTVGPIYYAAPDAARFEPEAAGEDKGFWQRVHALGRPLLVGLAITATLCGLFAYLLISLSWRWCTWRKRRRAQAAR